ncbi:MAG: rhamnogalacturonan acetylesterase [Fibrobacteria bacterium]
MRRLLAIFLGVMSISATNAPVKPTFWILGDSTAALNPISSSQRGWAQLLDEFFNLDSVAIQDKALGGRSSKSFLTDREGWPAFKDMIKAGDVVLIQFGHNDEKTQADLSTLPGSTFEEYQTIYIDFARKVGAIPILATSIQRNYWNSDGKTLEQSHVIPGRGDYPQATRNLAAAKQVPLVDMTKLTEAYMLEIGKAASTKLFVDAKAHPNVAGARAISKLFTDDLVKQKIVPLQNWLKGTKPVSIASGAATHDIPDEIISVGNDIVRIKCNEMVSAFSILKLNGEIEYDLGKANEGNTLSLTGKNGKPLSPGKYILRYQVSGGASRSALIEKR